MGYNRGESKNLIANTQYLGSEIDNERHFAKDKFTLTDKDGNKIYYELQSTKQSKKDGSFGGYLIAQTNIDSENYEKLLASAKKYFAEHPEERPKYGDSVIRNSSTAITSDYSKILIAEAAADSFRGESGRNNTNMEKLFLYQYSYLEQINTDPNNITYLSWEQILGQQDFGDDHIEQSRKSIENDTLRSNNPFSNIFSEEWEESANRGEISLREKLKNDAQAQQKIITQRTADGNQIMTFSQDDKASGVSFTEDEMNALIRYSIQRKGNDGK